SENYTLGRGELYFDKFVPGTFNKTGERYLGNSPELNLTTESETLDHFNSDRGIRVKDKSILLEKRDSGSFILDESSTENVALWFLGDIAVVAQSAQTAQVENVPANRLKSGTYLQIGASLANPTGVRNLSNVTVTSDPPGTTYASNVDYTLDAALGRLYIVPGGAIDGTQPIIVNYDTAASTREQIVVGDGTTVEGALRFISYNPTGPRRDYYWPYVQLRADGDLALKGDEWQQLSFAFDILKRDGYASQ
ncbi:UNVERIFIED_CONTAM: hypothetical protein IGO34_23755, partial [Salmonella enterica subsp. enterica serovar Weltevreden]